MTLSVVFITFLGILILELNLVDRLEYTTDYFVGFLVFLNFVIGCVGTSVLFFNLSTVSSLRPNFALLVFICWLPVTFFSVR